jgi:hypothetical protein
LEASITIYDSGMRIINFSENARTGTFVKCSMKLSMIDAERPIYI